MNGQDVDILLQALPYMRRHRGATIVVKCGGEIARDVRAIDHLASDIALCAHVGIRPVVVHGGGPQATDLSRKLGVEPKIVQGRRITDDATLEVAKMVYAGQINIDILGALRRHGIKPVGLSGVDGDLLNATRRPETEVEDPATGEKQRVDFGHVGDITDVDTRLLRKLLDEGYIPVLASLGADSDGNIYNINADTVAARVAMDLEAHKLLLLTNAPGLLENSDDPKSLVSHISAARAEKMLQTGAIKGGMVPKITTLIEAVRGGVRRGHILDGKSAHSLLIELFTREGTGTMLTTREEEKRYLDE
ncbi:MAG: acetylglutamate kinase [Planctomycetota bacterium]|jgi:acetylglutamate kinase|nr:acetylglutamate kinase [Planctomycetota bacterium]